MKRYINPQLEPKAEQSYVESTTVTTETSAMVATDRTDHPADQPNDSFHSFDPSSNALIAPLRNEANETSNSAQNDSSNRSDTSPEEITAYLDDIANIANSDIESSANFEAANDMEHLQTSRPNYSPSFLPPPSSPFHRRNASSNDPFMSQVRNRSHLFSTPIVMVTDKNVRQRINSHSFGDTSIEISN